MVSRKAWKIFRSMQETQGGWHSHDFQTLYEGFGFRMKEGRGHTIYRHKDYPFLEDVIPRHPKELGSAYAREAVKLIKRLLELTGETEDD